MKKARKIIMIVSAIILINILFVSALNPETITERMVNIGLNLTPIQVVEEVINSNVTINGHAKIINHVTPLTVIEGDVEVPEYSNAAIRGITADRIGIYGYSETYTGIVGKGKEFGISGVGDYGTGVYGMGQNFGLYGYSTNVGVYGWGGRDQGYGGKFYGYTGVYAATTGPYGFETPNGLFVGSEANIQGRIKGQVISVFVLNNTGYQYCNKFDNAPETWNWECIRCIKSSGQKTSCYNQEQNVNCICRST